MHGLEQSVDDPTQSLKQTSPHPWPGSNQFSCCLLLPRDIISGVINFDARSHLGKNTVFWPSDEITPELPVWGSVSSPSKIHVLKCAKNTSLKMCKKHLSHAVYNLRGDWCAALKGDATHIRMEDGLKRWASLLFPPDRGTDEAGSHQDSWPHAHGKACWCQQKPQEGWIQSAEFKCSLMVRSRAATYATLNPVALFQLWI